MVELCNTVGEQAQNEVPLESLSTRTDDQIYLTVQCSVDLLLRGTRMLNAIRQPFADSLTGVLRLTPKPRA